MALTVDLAALDGTLHDLASALRAAKQEVAKWNDGDDDESADAADCAHGGGGGGGEAAVEKAAAEQADEEVTLSEGLRDLQAFVVRGEEELRAVRVARSAAARQGAEVLSWLGEAPPHASRSSSAQGKAGKRHADDSVVYMPSALTAGGAGAGAGGGGGGETLQSFLKTLLGVVDSVNAAAADNARAAEAEERRLKRLKAAEEKDAKAKQEAAKVKAEQLSQPTRLGRGASLVGSGGGGDDGGGDDGGGGGGGTLRADPEYAKFVKMVSLRVPLGVVRAKVLAAGLDPSVVDPSLHQPDGPVPPHVLAARSSKHGGGGGGCGGGSDPSMALPATSSFGAAATVAVATQGRWARSNTRLGMKAGKGMSKLRGSASMRSSSGAGGLAVRGSMSGGGALTASSGGGGCAGGRNLGGGGLLGALTRMRTNMDSSSSDEDGDEEGDWGDSDDEEA